MKTVMFIISMFFMFSVCSLAGQSDVPTSGMAGMKADFLNPPAQTRPGCYWYWINDNISKAGITQDLEAMARVGIGRAFIGHIFNRSAETDTPVGDVQFMSDSWWEAVQWAVAEGDRCGVEIGVFNSTVPLIRNGNPNTASAADPKCKMVESVMPAHKF